MPARRQKMPGPAQHRKVRFLIFELCLHLTETGGGRDCLVTVSCQMINASSLTVTVLPSAELRTKKCSKCVILISGARTGTGTPITSRTPFSSLRLKTLITSSRFKQRVSGPGRTITQIREAQDTSDNNSQWMIDAFCLFFFTNSFKSRLDN